MTIKELHERLKALGVNNVNLSTVDEFLSSRNIKIEDVTDSVVGQIAADFKDQAASGLVVSKVGKAAKTSKRNTRGDRAQETVPTLNTSLSVLSQKTSQEIESIVDVAEQGVNQYVKHTANRLADIFQEAPNSVLKELGVLAEGAQSDAESFRLATRNALAGTVFALNDDAA